MRRLILWSLLFGTACAASVKDRLGHVEKPDCGLHIGLLSFVDIAKVALGEIEADVRAWLDGSGSLEGARRALAWAIYQGLKADVGPDVTLTTTVEDGSTCFRLPCDPRGES